MDQSVGNAVLVLIIAATLIVERMMSDVPEPKAEGHELESEFWCSSAIKR